MPTLQTLFDDNEQTLKLAWIAGRSGGLRALAAATSAEVQAADIVGHLNLIHADRLHVLGAPEVRYLTHMDSGRRAHYAHDLIAGGALGLIVAEALQLPDDMVTVAEQVGLAIFGSSLAAGLVIDRLRVYLNKTLAAHCTMHGVFMDVLGMGVLIAGESGVGKSELGLELISRGHGLVADDVVDLARTEPDSIEGHCPPLLANLLEVRGLGLLDIKAIFGETAVRRKMRLRLIVHLVRKETMEREFERLPYEPLYEDILEIPVRKVVIAVDAGRNLAVLVEAAVRNTVLQLRGIDTYQEFIKRHQSAMDDPQ